ncbi:GNAT family N-acetyltransferase [Neobacillus mesonae]|nr:GNAT family N-acetyltransferase [Neobacillus mesonae]
MEEIEILRMKSSDILKLMPLVEESTNEGFRHIKRLVTDYEAKVNRFDTDGEALFLASKNGDIVGVCGLNKDPYSVKEEVGRVRRLYVSPSVRRFGVGRMLMNSVMIEAADHYKILVLRTDNPDAYIFYRSLGFSVKVNSQYDTHFLRLGSS